MKYISSDSYKINDKLRRGTALSKGDRQFVEVLDQALRKLPEYRGRSTDPSLWVLRLRMQMRL